MTITTQTGRTIPAPPQIRTDTDRKAAHDLKKLQRWLLDQGKAEAEATANSYVADLLEHTTLPLSDGDKCLLNEFLFGEPYPTWRMIDGAWVRTAWAR